MDSAKRKELQTKNRKTKADYRNEIQPAPPPPAPFIVDAIDSALSQGTHGIKAARRKAWQAARKYSRDLAEQWTRPPSQWLEEQAARAFHRHSLAVPAPSSERTPRTPQHARARYIRATVAWRARFLGCLSITHCPTLAARHANVSRSMAFQHRANDPDFARDWQDALDHAADLLQARAFARALEGDLEPVHYMGVIVDHVRKFDGRLQIEMLRGLRPATFKTAGVNVSIGTKGDVFVLTEEQRHELMAINRAYLESAPLPVAALPAPAPAP